MSAPSNLSGLHYTDISMHLPHPLASAFECVAIGGAEAHQQALNWIVIEKQRRTKVSTQGFDSVVYGLTAFRQWHVGDSATEVLRYQALSAIVQTACNWMHPELLGQAREAVVELMEAIANG